MKLLNLRKKVICLSEFCAKLKNKEYFYKSKYQNYIFYTLKFYILL